MQEVGTGAGEGVSGAKLFNTGRAEGERREEVEWQGLKQNYQLQRS
jgi:hypothetical protein